MILIADSGSTATTWGLLRGNEVEICLTSGINPFFLTSKEITQLLENEFTMNRQVAFIYFYGAGCSPEKQSVVTEALDNYFETNFIEVKSDLWAAARSLCREEEGIACILGTGSNSCYYNGNNIVKNVPPLGYILGDEGSGATLGKKLIAGILKSQLPEPVIRDFQDTYSWSMAEILDCVYRRPFPNRFLAQFAPFLRKHVKNGAVKQLVIDSFTEFIAKNILQYEKVRELPIHVTGSVAFYFKSELKAAFDIFQLHLGIVSEEPIQGLIEYHKNRVNHD
ncbi:MAG: ATPase [Dysgonamonadaceae bacterium]|jgi:N-acetylglucosamine kinase-like BadF-type ATPase|nr:ATPase [Dysgonamonadaceae bacterium]